MTSSTPPHPVSHWQELDTRDQQHADFWQALSVVADQEIVDAARQEEIDKAR